MVKVLELWYIFNLVFITIMDILLKVYILSVEFRFLLQFFMQFNPYIEPLRTLWIWTNPVFHFLRKYFPKMAGLDMCPMFNMILLRKLSKFLTYYVSIYPALCSGHI